MQLLGQQLQPCYSLPISWRRQRFTGTSQTFRCSPWPRHLRSVSRQVSCGSATAVRYTSGMQEHAQTTTSEMPQHWTQKQRDLLKRYMPWVAQINALEPAMQALTLEDLKAKTAEFRGRLSRGATLADLLPEAFAVVREVSSRVLRLRHYDVQLIGGMVLQEGNVAEMRTGEGKTLVATLPAYLNALTGHGVHIVTVNDYLAQRDSEWVGKVFKSLGLSVAFVRDREHQDLMSGGGGLFQSDITYATATTLCFAYIRDNIASAPDQLMMVDAEGNTRLNYVIADEVDELLIDDCSTPMVISSGLSPNPTATLRKVFGVAKQLKLGERTANASGRGFKASGDFVILSKQLKDITITPDGTRWAEEQLRKEGLLGDKEGLWGLPAGADFRDLQSGGQSAKATAEGPAKATDDAGGQPTTWQATNLGGTLISALRAEHCYLENVDYVVLDGQVMLLNSKTGRLRDGMRLEDTMHQLLEAKHGLKIRPSSPPAASITYQCFFNFYRKIAGMTGTAVTEQSELLSVYGLDVVEVPPHRPSRRIDRGPYLFPNQGMEIQEVCKKVWSAVNREVPTPVLIGTVSLEDSEKLYNALWSELGSLIVYGVKESRHNINLSVLNAKPENVRHEAQLIAKAGMPGRVTIATNMAGRGTDILLGGNPKGLTHALLMKLWAHWHLEDGVYEEHQDELDDTGVPELQWKRTPGNVFSQGKLVLEGLSKWDDIKSSVRRGELPLLLWYSLRRLEREYRWATDQKAAAADARNAGLAKYKTRTFAEQERFIASHVEKVERLRAEYLGRMSGAAGSGLPRPSLQAMLEYVQQQFTENIGDVQTVAYITNNLANTKYGEGVNRELLRAGLGLWLWLDEKCAVLADEVRRAGGLLVFCTGMQPTRRGRLQLSGRAGRQGDPGQTITYCNLEQAKDVIASPMVYQMLMNRTVAAGSEPVAFDVLDKVAAQMEGVQRSQREAMRQHDEVLQIYRRHFYDLRRLILLGSPERKLLILRELLQERADEIVEQHVDPSKPIASWEWDDLLYSINQLLELPTLKQEEESTVMFENFPLDFGGSTEGNGAIAVSRSLEASSSAGHASAGPTALVPSYTFGLGGPPPTASPAVANSSSAAGSHAVSGQAVSAGTTELSSDAVGGAQAVTPGMEGGHELAASAMLSAFEAVDQKVQQGASKLIPSSQQSHPAGDGSPAMSGDDALPAVAQAGANGAAAAVNGSMAPDSAAASAGASGHAAHAATSSSAATADATGYALRAAAAAVHESAAGQAALPTGEAAAASSSSLAGEAAGAAQANGAAQLPAAGPSSLDSTASGAGSRSASGKAGRHPAETSDSSPESGEPGRHTSKGTGSPSALDEAGTHTAEGLPGPSVLIEAKLRSSSQDPPAEQGSEVDLDDTLSAVSSRPPLPQAIVPAATAGNAPDRNGTDGALQPAAPADLDGAWDAIQELLAKGKAPKPRVGKEAFKSALGLGLHHIQVSLVLLQPETLQQVKKGLQARAGLDQLPLCVPMKQPAKGQPFQSVPDEEATPAFKAEMDLLRETLQRNKARAPLQGPYAEEARTLQDWLGQFLMARYETRRSIVAAEFRSTAARHVAKHANPVTPEFLERKLAKLEMDTMLFVMDDLWIEFLQDAQRIQVTCALGAFARRDPLAQFKNDLGKTFLALMKDFRAETAYAAFQGYEPPSILDQD